VYLNVNLVVNSFIEKTSCYKSPFVPLPPKIIPLSRVITWCFDFSEDRQQIVIYCVKGWERAEDSPADKGGG